jgi:hypothetical protein
MIEKKTIIDQIEITRNGTVQIRLGLLILEDGQEIDSKWHRTALPPGHDVTAQIAAVNAHLALMGKPAVSETDAARITSVCTQAWTPEVIAAYEAAQLANQEEGIS